MISKINKINNLAVFQEFDWDSSVRDKNVNISEFRQINILYGRNYSGKTTLSRIIRSLETGVISNKYENPSFSVLFKDGRTVVNTDLTTHSKKIRVFNEDFIKDNLQFITNPDENVKPFAIMGENNTIIEAEIQTINDVLGSSEENNETGLYADKKLIETELKKAKDNHDSAQSKLDEQLRAKATGRDTGIRYNSDKFGNQNYTIKTIGEDIEKVLDIAFISINNKEQKELEQLLEEKVNDVISPLKAMKSNFKMISEQANILLTKKVGKADKIQELVDNAFLHKWVKDGRAIHKGNRDTCVFCNNEIKESRWIELEKHFDEESEKLEDEIDSLIHLVSNEQKKATGYSIEEKQFYYKYHAELETLKKRLNDTKEKYNLSLDEILNQLQIRKNNLMNNLEYKPPLDVTQDFKTIEEDYEILRNKSNEFRDLLDTEQSNAKELLRLREVYDFVHTIDYSKELVRINRLLDEVNKIKVQEGNIKNLIYEKLSLIESKNKQLNDESKGAEKVNEYLKDFFGHGFLSLKAIEDVDDNAADKKKFRFEIIRDGKKAYHMSEGECSLIAFCYFMAKLQDIDTKDATPIIWIDDPISSLDSNHIFFIYSLINAEIVENKKFEQLFISTHNLDFLKYLKRLPGADHDKKEKEHKKKFQYFIIQRDNKKSTVTIMPDYLREYVTEFNYLFHQLYKCASITTIDDSNFSVFYNFGNNARKFLEIFLYYKYPDNSTKEIDKLQKFFGNETIPTVLTNRINNEFSHLAGVFERGSTTVDAHAPEMQLTAKAIINKIMEDRDQYESLMKSIGEPLIASGLTI